MRRHMSRQSPLYKPEAGTVAKRLTPDAETMRASLARIVSYPCFETHSSLAPRASMPRFFSVNAVGDALKPEARARIVLIPRIEMDSSPTTQAWPSV
jgi:hypothetical protein